MWLARFVYHVKDRLKSGVQQCFHRKKSLIELPQISLEAQARQALNPGCNKVEHGGETCKGVVTVKRPRLLLEVPSYDSIRSPDYAATYKPPHFRLLEKLDEQTADEEPRTRSVATCDRLFLAYNAGAVTRSKGIDELRHIYDLTTLLLARLSSSRDSKSRLGLPANPSASALCGVDHEKFLANLEHLLRCLRQAALEALIFHGLRRLDEDVRQWHQRWLRDRQLDYGWFLEWPNGRRPLSTTSPWNIRPSLVVLWGVCWMFYDNSTRSVKELRQQLEDQEVASSFWPSPTPQCATTNQHPAWLQTDVGAGVSARRNCSNPTFLPAHRHSAPSSLLALSPNLHEWDDPPLFPPQHSQRHPQHLASTTRGSSFGDTAQSYAPSSQQETSQGDYRAATFFSPSLRPPMGPMQNYPSPHSDVSRDETRSSNFSVLPSNDVSPDMMFAASPSIASHPSEVSPGRRSEEPPRNPSGQITCIHPKCARELPIFARKCEWTKHMDKHTRPYVCNLPGCEKVRGFTYSGGLSRHQREVHRQHGGPKASYMCPHKDCKRSTGSGFSRKENLQEHLRRVHCHIGDVPVDKQATQETTAQQVSGEPRRRRRRVADDDDDEDEAPLLPEPKKRKRKVEEGDGDEDIADHDQKEDLTAQVKRLRKELEAKDERLRKLEQTVELLTKGGI
ncbi:MAG: hypothetical protein Q9224_003865 [Gallowayella concinna]